MPHVEFDLQVYFAYYAIRINNIMLKHVHERINFLICLRLLFLSEDDWVQELVEGNIDLADHDLILTHLVGVPNNERHPLRF